MACKDAKDKEEAESKNLFLSLSPLSLLPQLVDLFRTGAGSFSLKTSSVLRVLDSDLHKNQISPFPKDSPPKNNQFEIREKKTENMKQKILDVKY